MTKKKARTTRTAPKRLPSIFDAHDPPKTKPVPKTKAQLIEENERLQKQVQNRDILLMFGSLALGYLTATFSQQQKPTSKSEPTTAIVKAKS